jgi:hypothetical protein
MGKYLVYRPHNRDRDSDYLHIIDLENDFTIKVKVPN